MLAISLTIACSCYTYDGYILPAHPVRGESHNQRNTTGEVATTSPPFYNEPHRSHVLCVKAELRTTFTSWSQHHFVEVSLTLWIWFTLSYAMMKALLRLAPVRDTKQAGELRGDTVHFIASSSALVLMMQNGSTYRPLTQTVTCLLRWESSKHIAENS